MKKIISGFLILIITLSIVAFSAYSLLSDSVSLSFGLTVLASELDIDVRNLVNKAFNLDDVEPEDNLDPGSFEVFNKSIEPAKIFLYFDKLDGDVCEKLNFIIEVSESSESTESTESSNGLFSNIFEGPMEELKGKKNKLLLSSILADDILGANDSIFVKMFPSFSDEINKNEQSDDCKWDDIVLAESETQKKDEPKFTDNEKIENNNISLGYWILPYVEVKSPIGGESYEVGDKVNVKWKVKTTHHDKDDQVKIDVLLYGGDELLLTIVSTEENDSSYHWIVPESLAGRNDLKIKVVAVDGNGLTAEDFSDGTFEVLGDLVD